MIKAIPLNYRYKYHGIFSHVLEIRKVFLRKAVLRKLEEIHGPGEWAVDILTWKWQRNENYRYDAKKKRIFVKSPEDVTLLLLLFSQEN